MAKKLLQDAWCVKNGFSGRDLGRQEQTCKKYHPDANMKRRDRYNQKDAADLEAYRIPFPIRKKPRFPTTTKYLENLPKNLTEI